MAMPAEDVAGKVLAIFFPIMAFVAMGFDHVVANMFFLPAAIFAGASYWYLYGRDTEAPGDEPPSAGESGRFVRVGRTNGQSASAGSEARVTRE
jgi:hypothetical protein